MQEALVSILIPVCNAEGTITAAIASCLRQTYKLIEIIVLDDASDDGTVREIEKFRQVRLIKHAQNAGRPAARNALLKEARGEFIAWLDADDYMLPRRIERQVLFMRKNPKVDIAGSWILTDNIALPKRKFPVDHAMISAYLWFKNCLVQPAVLSRNFYVKEAIFYDTDYYFMQDYELWFRLRNKKVFANIPEYLTHYHFSSAAETEQKNKIYDLKQHPDKLWELKWATVDFSFDPEKELLLQKFLSGWIVKGAEEAGILKGMFNIMLSHPEFGKIKENRYMIHLYRLLIFKGLSLRNRFFNLDLLTSVRVIGVLRQTYLIQ